MAALAGLAVAIWAILQRRHTLLEMRYNAFVRNLDGLKDVTQSKSRPFIRVERTFPDGMTIIWDPLGFQVRRKVRQLPGFLGKFQDRYDSARANLWFLPYFEVGAKLPLFLPLTKVIEHVSSLKTEKAYNERRERDEYETAYFDVYLAQAIDILKLIRQAKSNLEFQWLTIAVLLYSSAVAMILALGF